MVVAAAWSRGGNSRKTAEKTAGIDSYIYGACLSDLARLATETGNFSKAASLFTEVLNAYEKSVGKGNPGYPNAMIGLAKIYTTKKEYEKAEPWFLQAKELYLKKIEVFFPTLSEFEKEAFYQSVNDSFKSFNSFCLLGKEQNPGILVAHLARGRIVQRPHHQLRACLPRAAVVRYQFHVRRCRRFPLYWNVHHRLLRLRLACF